MKILTNINEIIATEKFESLYNLNPTDIFYYEDELYILGRVMDDLFGIEVSAMCLTTGEDVIMNSMVKVIPVDAELILRPNTD